MSIEIVKRLGHGAHSPCERIEKNIFLTYG
jgi:hypothetical protein